jgi:hypothetical protein
MKKSLLFILPTLAFILSSFLSGCGYKVGSLMHPQVKSIAIAPVVNETRFFNLASQVRGLLAESFQVDGSLQLTNENKADCIIYTRILKAEFKDMYLTDNDANLDDEYTPRQWRVVLTVEFTVMIPGNAEPLVAKQTVLGSTDFMTKGDLENSRRNALKQAALSASRLIVSAVTENW